MFYLSRVLRKTFFFAYLKTKAQTAALISDFVFSLLSKDNVNSLNFLMPDNIAVIYLKFKQKAQTLGKFIKKK